MESDHPNFRGTPFLGSRSTEPPAEAVYGEGADAVKSRGRTRVAAWLAVGAVAAGMLLIWGKPASAEGGVTGVGNPDDVYLSRARKALMASGIYDFSSMEVMPNDVEISQYRTLTDLYDAPDLLKGRPRSVREVGPSASVGMPTGSPRRRMGFDFPEGVRPVVLVREAQRYPNQPPVRQRWFFIPASQDQTVGYVNEDGSYRVDGQGPMAFLLDYDSPEGSENPMTIACLTRLNQPAPAPCQP